jgi:hypothetical protein
MTRSRRAMVVGVMLAALSTAPAVAAQAPPRSESYTVGYGLCQTDGNPGCNTQFMVPLAGLGGWDIGDFTSGVGFIPDPGDKTVTITVSDLTRTAVPFAVSGVPSEEPPAYDPYYHRIHCGHATFRTAPGAMVTVYLVQAGYDAIPHLCPGLATTGTVTATFRR